MATRDESPRPLSRVVSMVSDWRTLIGAALALIAAGGVAYAFKDSLATKAELVPILAHQAKDDQERATIIRALQDLKENQDRSMQWLWDLHQRRR